MAPAYVAVDVIHRGLAPEVQPGEPLPATFLNSAGEDEPYDVERLLELGAIEPAGAADKRKAEKPAEEGGSEDAAQEQTPAKDAAPAAPEGSAAAKPRPKRAPAKPKAKSAPSRGAK